MKKDLAAIILAILLVTVFVPGGGACANIPGGGTGIDTPRYGSGSFTYADGTRTSRFERVVQAEPGRKDLRTLVKSGVTNTPAGKTVYTNSCGTIDVSSANNGYVTLKLTGETPSGAKGGTAEAYAATDARLWKACSEASAFPAKRPMP